MTTKPFLTITLLVLLSACAPQAEFVKTKGEMVDLREDTTAMKAQVSELQKRIDVLDTNIKGTLDAQKVMADYGARADQLATDIQLLQGKLEENNFRIAELAQKVDDKSVKIAELSARIDELEAKVKLAGGGTSAATAATGTAAEKDKKSVQKTAEPSEAYRQAKSDFDRGNFDLALAGFQNYITQFHDSSQVDNAQYWVGECYYAKKDFPKSIEAFEKVIKNYPRSEKVPGAKLKIGLAYLNEKKNAKAKEYLQKVIKEHPATTEAEIAKDRLHRIK
jgi:tol-pal system protein YbgF